MPESVEAVEDYSNKSLKIKRSVEDKLANKGHLTAGAHQVAEAPVTQSLEIKRRSEHEATGINDAIVPRRAVWVIDERLEPAIFQYVLHVELQLAVNFVGKHPEVVGRHEIHLDPGFVVDRPTIIVFDDGTAHVRIRGRQAEKAHRGLSSQRSEPPMEAFFSHLLLVNPASL